MAEVSLGALVERHVFNPMSHSRFIICSNSKSSYESGVSSTLCSVLCKNRAGRLEAVRPFLLAVSPIDGLLVCCDLGVAQS